MYLFETIKCLDGVLYNLPFHNFRLNKARVENFGQTEEIQLENFIKVPEDCKVGLFRCRVFYAAEFKNPEFIPHQYRELKSLKLLRIIKLITVLNMPTGKNCKTSSTNAKTAMIS
jgi:4-amino-4-deoxychorismate lyase